jgi:RNA polymerase sigma-70 factor (sigma-E family)
VPVNRDDPFDDGAGPESPSRIPPQVATGAVVASTTGPGSPAGTPPPTGAGQSSAESEFQDFFESHHRELARFAYLLAGDHDAADDIAADALASAWLHWERVRTADNPLAYVRRIVANLAASRLRRTIRERRGMATLGMLADHSPGDTDIPALLDLRAALMTLPARKRACVVLRYAFDLSESETASTLGISVGTVKSQTSKGVAELERLLRSGAPQNTAGGVPVPLPRPRLESRARPARAPSGPAGSARSPFLRRWDNETAGLRGPRPTVAGRWAKPPANDTNPAGGEA